MTVTVSFVKPRGVASLCSPGIGFCRVAEDLALTETTTASREEGETVIVANGETSMIRVAFGTTPDAATGTATSATSAGVPIPAGLSMVFVPVNGDKFNVKALA